MEIPGHQHLGGQAPNHISMRHFALILGEIDEKENDKSTVKWLRHQELIETSVRLVEEDNASRKVASQLRLLQYVQASSRLSNMHTCALFARLGKPFIYPTQRMWKRRALYT